MSYIYDFLGGLQQKALMFMHFALPQLTLFDVSGKVVHGPSALDGSIEPWPPLAGWAVAQLTVYGAVYSALFLGAAYLLFRRRPI